MWKNIQFSKLNIPRNILKISSKNHENLDENACENVFNKRLV